jgi:predicted AlkP superfamily phosphohydrolase/phosphomutase
MEKAILLALDGFSWNLINELINNNKMKHLKSIINKGVSSKLIAEGFLSSPKIFCSIFTGKIPEKHGIRDFYSKESDLNSEQIWDILESNRYKIGLYRPLSVWKAKEYDGFCIPNPLLLKKSTFPEELNFIGDLDIKARSEAYSLKFLMKTFWKLIKFHFPLTPLFKITRRAMLLFFKKGLQERIHLLKEIELIIHSNLYLKLLKKFELDFSVFFDYSFDTLSHIYWRDKGEASKYEKILPNAYKIVDHFIGKVNKIAQKDNYYLVICSDHGFESIKKEDRQDYRAINTLYLLRELNYYYDIYGIYMRGKVVFRVRPNSKLALKEFKNALEFLHYESEPLFEIKAYTKKLIVRINQSINLIPTLKIDFPNGKKLRVDSIIDFNPAHTGDHSKDNGVFIIYGPKVKKGLRIGDITPYDITPTILRLLNIELPPDIDGKVLEELLE